MVHIAYAALYYSYLNSKVQISLEWKIPRLQSTVSREFQAKQGTFDSAQVKAALRGSSQ